MTSCLYCVNPDCAGAGIDNPSTQLITACALFLDPRKELVRVREESAVHKLASETLHSELVRVTAHAKRLAQLLQRYHDEFNSDPTEPCGCNLCGDASAALAEQPAQESKPAEPAGGK